MIASYGRIWNLGHRECAELLPGEVLVQEKVDGSQFSFALAVSGDVEFRSKNQDINPIDPGMFGKGVTAIIEVAGKLMPGWTFRGEYLSGPRHNVLKYDRAPQRNVVLFDIQDADGTFLPPRLVKEHAEHLGVDYAPVFFAGLVTSAEQVLSYLERESVLGGAKIEGVVLKAYDRKHRSGDVFMGKYVGAAFKETKIDKSAANASAQYTNDVIFNLTSMLKTERRWAKAVEAVRDMGKIEGSPKDIGPILQYLTADIEAENIEEIKDALLAWAWPQLRKSVTAGFPEWYKQSLLAKQFNPGVTE